MRLLIAVRFRDCISRLALCAAPLITGCSLIQVTPGPPPEAKLIAAYVVVGENGMASARAITAESPLATCPVIKIDGTTQRMQVRAPAATIPQRPTASTIANSKPSAFPVMTCEFSLPANTASAIVGDIALRLPKANPQRIVVLADTGCRMKAADNAWQPCVDEEAWPFRPISELAAAMAPDLVVHIGDFHYRENACPPHVTGCQGSPWGYGWDTWQADLFDPAAKLLAAAPWVVARGNHEECRRAGQGWFRFLDTQAFSEARSCNDAANDAIGNFSQPYAVPLSADLQLIIFDSAVAGDKPLDLAKPRDAHTLSQYRQQFATVDALARKPGVNSIFINHHPILGFSSDETRRVFAGNPALMSAMKPMHPQRYYPPSVNLALHGHVHLFQAINFSSSHPATVVTHAGGSQTYPNFPDPFPTGLVAAEGITLESITHGNQFGFAVMDKRETDWQLSVYNHRGTVLTTCMLIGSKVRCDKAGLLK